MANVIVDQTAPIGLLGDLIWRFNPHFTRILLLLTTTMDLAMQLMQLVLLPCMQGSDHPFIYNIANGHFDIPFDCG